MDSEPAAVLERALAVPEETWRLAVRRAEVIARLAAIGIGRGESQPPAASALAFRCGRASGGDGTNRRSDRQRRSAPAIRSVANHSSGAADRRDCSDPGQRGDGA